MKIKMILFVPFLLLLTFSSVGADELDDAYKKEYTFLKAQKGELEERLLKEKKQQNTEIVTAKEKVENLQGDLIVLVKRLKGIERNKEKAEKKLQDKLSNKEIVKGIVDQARIGLEEQGITVDETAGSLTDTMEQIFKDSAKVYNRNSSITIQKGSFYLLDGTTVNGEIVNIGGIAAYGVSTKAGGALIPAGNSEYKIINKSGSDDDARALHAYRLSESIDIFIYENLDKNIEYQKEKTYKDTIKSGGVIGYTILGLGVFGILLIFARFIFLLKAGSNVKKITGIVCEKLEKGCSDEAYNEIRKYRGSIASVIRATLRNIKRDREHIEDIITESILNENRILNRFGSLILVIASVAPLLGLLGTVTGMISTFDIITLHGTGNPKLLSTGIAEALVTTMFGLIVAIPLLLLGNISKGWADNIKDAMEQSALHVVNLFEKYNVK